jgi:hypothetical protein
MHVAMLIVDASAAREHQRCRGVRIRALQAGISGTSNNAQDIT